MRAAVPEAAPAAGLDRADVETRRREVHERARAAVEEMREPPGESSQPSQPGA